MTHAEPSRVRQPLDRQRFFQVIAREAQGDADAIDSGSICDMAENCDCPPERRYGTTSSRATRRANAPPMVTLDQCQREIDACRDACRGPDTAVGYEDSVWIYAYRGITFLQLARHTPAGKSRIGRRDGPLGPVETRRCRRWRSGPLSR